MEEKESEKYVSSTQSKVGTFKKLRKRRGERTYKYWK